ncbi:MAG: Crp/Fnr family transcriptional regulator [Epsilonproteobacteria bacterium]|nr:Crp/Fnr family transcriptional regulator [Campylobacterota bacterium]
MNLDEFYFFNTLHAQELKELQNITFKKSFKAGEILFYAGEKPKYLYLLACGVVKLYKHDFRDNEVLIHNLGAPNLIAEIVNFEEGVFPANCAFVSDGEVYMIDYERFKERFLSKSEISMLFIKSLTKKIKALESFINYNITADSYAKIAKFLLENEAVLSTLKQTKIAAVLNITPETLSRNITKMREANLITKERGKLLILDHKALKECVLGM